MCRNSCLNTFANCGTLVKIILSVCLHLDSCDCGPRAQGGLIAVIADDKVVDDDSGHDEGRADAYDDEEERRA